MYSGYKWLNSDARSEFGSLTGGKYQVPSGTFYGDGKYQVMNLDMGVAGWGDRVPPGYSVVGHGLTLPGGGFFGPRGSAVNQVVLQRNAPPPPPPPPAPAPPPPPRVEPQNPTPLVPASLAPQAQPQTQYSEQIASLLKQLNIQSAPTQSSAAPAPTQSATTTAPRQSTAAPPPPVIEMPEPSYSSSTAVGGNAGGFTRKQSAARKAGLTTKGTSRLKISRTGQNTASSGLNIGV
jgi:hypothetical protein